MTATGNWERHEIEEMTSTQQLDSGFDIVLQCMDHSVPWDYMRLVPEDLFFLSVDGPTVEVPDLGAYTPFLLELEYNPDKKNFRYGPYSISPYDTRIPPSCHPRAKAFSDVPILIPTVPVYLNALFDQLREHKGWEGLRWNIVVAASWNIRNFIRYLFLEIPNQRALILSELSGRNRIAMEDKLNSYRPKFSIGIDPKTRQLRTNIPWESAYPEGQDF